MSYTMELRLCGDDGMVVGDFLDLHAWLRHIGGHEPYVGPAYACTGSAHLAGQHIFCTSEFHRKPARMGLMWPQREGVTMMRVAREVRSVFADDPDVPADFLADLEVIEQAGRRALFANPILLPASVPLQFRSGQFA